MAREKLPVASVAMRLVGPISPIGETTTDNQNYENLEELIQATDQLLYRIHKVYWDNKDAHEFSMKRASDRALKFLKYTFETYNNLTNH